MMGRVSNRSSSRADVYAVFENHHEDCEGHEEKRQITMKTHLFVLIPQTWSTGGIDEAVEKLLASHCQRYDGDKNGRDDYLCQFDSTLNYVENLGTHQKSRCFCNGLGIDANVRHELLAATSCQAKKSSG